MRIKIIMVLLPVIVWPAGAATLYVDGSLPSDVTNGGYSITNRAAGGKDGNAYRSLAAALKMSRPGDVIQVRAGLYQGAVDLQGRCGTDTAPLTIQAYPGESWIATTSVPVTGWVKCDPKDPNLSRSGYINPHIANLWMVKTPDNTICLHEAGRKLPIASDPNMSKADWYRVEEMRDIPNEGNWGQDRYIMDKKLNPTKGFYNGAQVVVWSHNANNALLDPATVADSGNGILVLREGLGASLTNTGSLPDRYVIQNHPMILDKPGEWCSVTLTGGRCALYLWPRSESDLAANMRRNPSTNAYIGGGACFYATSGTSGKYLTIDGVTIQNSLGGIEFTETASDCNNLTIRHVTVKEGRGYGLYLYRLSKGLVEDCNLMGSTTRSIQLGSCRDTIITGNRIDASLDSAIITAGCQRMAITYNMIGETGTHGNGIAYYMGSKDGLIACNTILTDKVSIAINEATNIYVYGNLIRKSSGGSGLANWGGCTGDLVIANNTVIGCVAIPYGENGSGGTARTTMRVVNNIMQEVSFGSVTLHKNNVYLKKPGFTLDPSESVVDANKVFDASYRPLSGSIAAGGGILIGDLIPLSKFPGFKFTDHDGAAWNAKMDVGAFAARVNAPTVPIIPSVPSTPTVPMAPTVPANSTWTAASDTLPALDMDVLVIISGNRAIGSRQGTSTAWTWTINGLSLPASAVSLWTALPAQP